MQEGLQELLLGLLCNLALDDKEQSVRARIVRGGAMTASIMLLHSEDTAVQQAAAAALGGITTPGCVQACLFVPIAGRRIFPFLMPVGLYCFWRWLVRNH